MRQELDGAPSNPLISRRDLLVMMAVAPISVAVNHGHKYECQPATYTSYDFPRNGQGLTHPVYVAGSGPSVIVLHEITGANSEFFAFTNCLVAKGFQVHCPVLFGKPFAKPNLLRNLTYRWTACGVGSDVNCIKPAAVSRLNPWLVALAEDVGQKSGKPIGAIGMCLTGVQPLVMLRSKAVVAPVLCQPAIPIFGGKTDLGLPHSDMDFAAARIRAENLEVLAIRYDKDKTCPPERMERLRAFLQPNFRLKTLDGKGHSSLVGDASTIAFDTVVEFLNRLRA